MLAALEFRPFPDAVPALRELRGAGLRLVVASNWDCSLPDWLAAAGCSSWWTGWSPRPSAGAAKPGPAVFPRALELAGARAGRGAARGRLAGQRRRGRAGGGHPAACSCRVTARRRRPGVERCARSPSCPPYSEAPVEAPLRPTPAAELPRSCPPAPAPRWPAWYAGVGFLVGADRHADRRGHRGGGHRAPTPARATPDASRSSPRCMQSLIFVGTAVLFASFTRRPRAWHFGLRRAPLLAGRRLGRARDGLLLPARGGLLGARVSRTPSRRWRRTSAPTRARSG